MQGYTVRIDQGCFRLCHSVIFLYISLQNSAATWCLICFTNYCPFNHLPTTTYSIIDKTDSKSKKSKIHSRKPLAPLATPPSTLRIHRLLPLRYRSKVVFFIVTAVGEH